MVFIAAFGAGLVGLVIAMLRGVERPSPMASEDQMPRVRITLPTTSAFAVGAGAGGYFMARGASSPLLQLLVALSAGTLALLLLVFLISRSAAKGADPHLAAEMFQGHPALAVAEMSGTVRGAVSYESRNGLVSLPSLSITGNHIPAGTEVVIDRIENEVAYVEDWLSVERRI